MVHMEMGAEEIHGAFESVQRVDASKCQGCRFIVCLLHCELQTLGVISKGADFNDTTIGK